MRAHWLDPLLVDESYTIKGDALHHLVNVIRIETNEELLLLNGKGLFVETIVESISKRELRLKTIRHYTQERTYTLDLALGMPKRDALELCLKEATELGFRKIYLVKSDYSQMRIPEEERMRKLLVSALEQSNAPFLPEVVTLDWKDISWDSYEESVLLDSQTKESQSQQNKKSGERILIVGPEGGFSPSELQYLRALNNVQIVNLPTPILRSPTAVATGAGLLLQRLLK